MIDFSKPLQRKIEYSIALLQKAAKIAKIYDPENGYYLAFSDGKDSQALYHIAKMAGVPFKAHMNLTSVDPPEVIRFVKQQYPDVELIAPRKSLYQMAKDKGMPPTMRSRWCCAEYKETAGAGKVTLIGIRHEESSKRAKRDEVALRSYKFSGSLEEFSDYREKTIAKKGVTIVNATEESTTGCISGKDSLLISPIIQWTERDVWEFLNKQGIEHCCLYDEGYTRIGCLLCPMSSIKRKRKDLARYPHLRSRWVNVFQFLHDSERRALADSRGITAEEDFEWWISGQNFDKWYASNFLQQKLDL